MKTIILFLFTCFTLSASGQVWGGDLGFKGDTTKSKYPIQIDYDAIDFMEWVQEFWVYAGEFRDEKNYLEKRWRDKAGKKLYNSKMLWRIYYENVNACWWDY